MTNSGIMGQQQQLQTQFNVQNKSVTQQIQSNMGGTVLQQQKQQQMQMNQMNQQRVTTHQQNIGYQNYAYNDYGSNR